MITRRRLLRGIGLLGGVFYTSAWGGLGLARALAAQSGGVGASWPDALEAEAARLEKALPARVGLAVLDTASGVRFGHRAGERFPLCSTFKLLACAVALRRAEQGRERLDRRVVFTAADMVTWSPVTKDRVGGEGMTLDELCAAAMIQSDNSAANLILDSMGGPAGFTAELRGLGDPVSRLDRHETALGEATPGDPRDTTTPDAMLDDLHHILLGDALSPAGRERVLGWMLACETGRDRLRAGLPEGWKVGDKTGSGGHGSAADVAILWPADRLPMGLRSGLPDAPPLLVAMYLTETEAPAQARNAAFADVARALASRLAGG